MSERERDARRDTAARPGAAAAAEVAPGRRTLTQDGEPGAQLPFLQLMCLPGPNPAQEPAWAQHARAYNQHHPKQVAKFRAATGDVCVGADGALNPMAVARWQVAHGVDPDGRVGSRTVLAAAAQPARDAAPGASIATAPEASIATAPEHHELPAPAHVDGDVGAAEKVTRKPAAPSGKQVYAAGGALSNEHLHQFDLSAAELAFKKQVYDAAVARLGDKVYGGVPADDLVKTEGGHLIRKDIAGPLASMLAAMRSALQTGHAAGGVAVGKATDIHVTSGYRSPERDRDLWDHYFQKYLHHTVKEREATGNPLGSAAAHFMVKYIGQRKAPPGGSNHSNGIAVDLQIELAGHRIPNSFDDQQAWKASWHYAWLQAHAASFGFKNYPKEAWHWDHKG